MDIESDDNDYISSCNVCFMKFDDEHQRPKVLPCSHTFCFRCLQAIHSRERILNCPVCRTPSHVTDVATLPNNIYAQHIIQLNQKLLNPMMAMHWCFLCEGVATPGCKEAQHQTIDMSEDAKDLQGKMRQSQRNLLAAVGHRRQLDGHLEVALAALNAQAKLVREQIEQNRNEIEGLEAEINSGTRVPKVRKKIEARLDATQRVLDVAEQLKEDWRSWSEAMNWIHSNPGTSWRQVACLLKRRTGLSRTDLHLAVRKLKRTCLEEIPEQQDRLICSVFNPVRPMLACAYISGKVGLFSGKKHTVPFINWNAQIVLKSGHVISSIDWNSVGNELVIGFKRGTVAVWNLETKSVMEYGYCVPGSHVTAVRWNRKWAPDHFAACSKKSIVVWDVSRNTSPIFRFDAVHLKRIEDIAWISADMLISSCTGPTIHISQLGHPRPLKTFAHPGRGSFTPLRWNSNLEKLACCSSNSKDLLVWSLHDETPSDDDSSMSDSSSSLGVNNIPLIRIKSYGVLCVDWYPIFTDEDETPDARIGTLAGGTKESLVVIWNLYHEDETLRLVGHSGKVDDVAFSPDGKFLASLSVESELIVWSTQLWEKVIFLDGLTTESTIIWSPCCSKLVLSDPLVHGENDTEVHVVEIGR